MNLYEAKKIAGEINANASDFSVKTHRLAEFVLSLPITISKDDFDSGRLAGSLSAADFPSDEELTRQHLENEVRMRVEERLERLHEETLVGDEVRVNVGVLVDEVRRGNVLLEKILESLFIYGRGVEDTDIIREYMAKPTSNYGPGSPRLFTKKEG